MKKLFTGNTVTASRISREGWTPFDKMLEGAILIIKLWNMSLRNEQNTQKIVKTALFLKIKLKKWKDFSFFPSSSLSSKMSSYSC